jgi:hypothetical protein
MKAGERRQISTSMHGPGVEETGAHAIQHLSKVGPRSLLPERLADARGKLTFAQRVTAIFPTQ